MKLIVSIAALSFATAVSAQAACAAIASSIPACGTSCIQSAGAAVGCTVAGDYSCQCQPQNVAAINAAALLCVVSACGAVTGLEVSTAALAVCACAATAAPAGPASTAPSTSPASTTPPAPASSATSAIASATSAASTSAAGSASSVAASASSAVSSFSASVSSALSSVASSASSAASSAASVASAPTPSMTGPTSGQGLAQPMGVGAAILAVFAGVLAIL